jgi:hypothetical protein
MKDAKRYRLFKMMICMSVTVFLAGCLEATFELSPESRVPKWLDIPDGVPRKDIKVTMDYRSTFSGGEYIFKVFEKGKFVRLQKLSISLENQPTVRTQELVNPPEGFPEGYPAYNVVEVEGVIDIVERRKMEPVFYMTDDPAVWAELGVGQEK